MRPQASLCGKVLSSVCVVLGRHWRNLATQLAKSWRHVPTHPGPHVSCLTMAMAVFDGNGVVMEATKTAERAVRHTAKQAFPELKTRLQHEEMRILARQVLDRRMLMEANRDVVSLPGLVGATRIAVLRLAA